MISLGEGIASEQRGVSNTIAIVLLFGLVILGALLVVFLGSGALKDVQQRNDMEVAQQSMQDLSNRLSAIKAGGDQVATFSLPSKMNGETQVMHTTSINLTAYGNAACTTGDVDISTLVYENSQGELVGYEAGGVWRSYPGGGSTMVSPPEINYRNGRLQLSMSEFQGQMNSRIRARLNRSETQRFNRNLTRALFLNKTASELHRGATGGPAVQQCKPENLDKVTLELSGSPFSTAWYQYANDNFDDGRAKVVSSPGDPLEINFTLGNVRDPAFVVNDSNLPDTYQTNTALPVRPDVENTGGLGGTRNISVTVYEKTGPNSWQNVSTQHLETRTSIDGGDVERVPFANDVRPSVFDTAGTYRVSIDTEDRVFNHSMEVATTPADLTVDISAPSSMNAMADESVTAEIDNVGGLDTTRDFEFWFADRHIETREDLTLPSGPGGEKTISFDIPTNRQGQDLNATVIASTADPDGARPSDRASVSIGDNQFFSIESSSITGTPTAGDGFKLQTAIENSGDTSGEDDVTLRITYAENDTVATDANGTPLEKTISDLPLNSGQSKMRKLDVPAGIDTVGGYEYTIKTSNETVNGSFRISAAETPYFLVSEVDPDPETVIRGDDIDVVATVNNTGARDGVQDIEASFDGTDEDFVPDVSIDSVDGDAVNLLVPTSDTLAPGYYDLTVSSANTSLTEQVHVVKNQSATGIGSGGNTTITTTRNITASLTVLGTSLTGIGDYSDNGLDVDEETYYEIIRGPVTMHIYTSNASVPNERYYAWGPGTDLNSPSMRMKQLQESPLLTKNVTVGPGTELSVFAQSYRCDLDDAADVDIFRDYGVGANGDGVRTIPYGHSSIDADRVRCGFGDARLNISRNENPENLKILNRTDSKIPNYKEAGIDQRSAKEIIEDSSRVSINSTGHVQLDPDQRLLLYELSEPNANYADAKNSGDPDYNDAVVLFEVVEVQTTRKTDPEFELLDTDGPAQVDMGDVAEFNATIRNNGGRDGETNVELYVDGSLVTNKSTGTIGGTSNETVPISFSTTGFSKGIHTVEIRLSSNENESETRNLYIGHQSRPLLLPNIESAPTAVKPGSSIGLDTVVTNVGGSQDTQNLNVTVVSASGDLTTSSLTPTEAQQSVTLDSGNQASKSFSFDTPADKSGTVTFEVETRNGSKRTTVAVEEPTFLIDNLYVGTTAYDDGDTVTGTNINSLTAVVENPSRTLGQQDIRLRLDTDRDGSYEEDPLSVKTRRLRNNATLVTLATRSYGDSPGVYDYQIATDDDTFEGTLRIRDTPSDFTPEESTESDLISVDVNKIELG